MRCQHISDCFDDATVTLAITMGSQTFRPEPLCDACLAQQIDEYSALHGDWGVGFDIVDLPPTADPCAGDLVTFARYGREYIGRVIAVDVEKAPVVALVETDDNVKRRIERRDLLVIERAGLPTKLSGYHRSLVDDREPITLVEAA